MNSKENHAHELLEKEYDEISARVLYNEIRWDLAAKDYDKTYRYDNLFNLGKIVRRAGLTARVATTVRKDLTPGRSLNILEVGCGTGLYTVTLAAKLLEYGFTGWHITAIDISGPMLRRAEDFAKHMLPEVCQRGDIMFAQVDIHKAPASFKPGLYTTVTGHYVLQYCDLKVTLPAINELLAPGGLIHFYEPNALNPLVRRSLKNKRAAWNEAIRPGYAKSLLSGLNYQAIACIYLDFFKDVPDLLAPAACRLTRLLEHPSPLNPISKYAGTVLVSAVKPPVKYPDGFGVTEEETSRAA